MKLDISGVLLAYNEEDIIRTSIEKLEAALKKEAKQYEIIVVGFEGCSDQTNAIVATLSEENPRIRLVLQKISEKGYGRAFSLGLKAARYDWIFQSDADYQYDFSDLTKLVALAKSGEYDLVHGYRDPRRDPFERLVFASLYNLLLKAFYAPKVRDIDSGFKLFRRSSIQNICIESISGFAVAETVIKLKNRGGKIAQVGIRHLPRLTGEALSEKGVSNPLGLQLPNFKLVFGTLGEVFRRRKTLRV